MAVSLKQVGDTWELMLYGEIGPARWGLIDAESVIAELDRVPAGAPLLVRIHSVGGQVFEATAIYNALAPRKPRVQIDGLAASAASHIAMAGATIQIAANAFVMIHRAWSIEIGNTHQMRSTAEFLEKLDRGVLLNSYQARSKQSEQQILDWMDKETWFTAEEALQHKLVDAVIPYVLGPDDLATSESKAALAQFKRVPQSLLGQAAPGEPEPAASMPAALQKPLERERAALAARLRRFVRRAA